MLYDILHKEYFGALKKGQVFPIFFIFKLFLSLIISSALYSQRMRVPAMV